MADKSIVLTNKDGHGFRPPCYAQLAAYTELTYQEDFDLPHPVAIFNHSWGLVTQAFESTLDALQNIQDRQEKLPSESKTQTLLNTFNNLLHASAEFLDDIEKNISKTLGGKNKIVDISGSSSLRKTITIPCNKLKHNHNRLAYFEEQTSIFNVSGFAICHVHNGVLKPNPEIHKNGRGSSFNLELRRIVTALYLYAAQTGDKIQAMLPSMLIKQCQADSKSASLLTKISNLPNLTMHHETIKNMPLVSFDDSELRLENSNGTAWPMTKGIMTAMYSGDGYTRSFAVP